MPYRTDKMKLDSPFLDRRVKLLPCQRERCFVLHHEDGLGIRPLSRMFKVSRRLVQFICYPERQAKSLEQRADKGGSMAYYSADKHRAYMKKHRHHKNATLKHRPS
jgi:hypothetical protein